jgi:hypothetical protein
VNFRSKLLHWLFIVSGAIPLLALLGSPPQTMLLVYSLFVTAVLLRDRFSVAYLSSRKVATATLGAAVLVSGLLGETLAWANNYLAKTDPPILFHPQLIPDLILGFGFYGGWATAWMIVTRGFRFSFREVFCTTGIMGIVVENNLAVLKAVLASLLVNPLHSILLALYVFATYGSMAAIPFVVLDRAIEPLSHRSHWIKYPVSIVIIAGLAWLLTMLVHLVASPLGLIPPRRSIVDHPFF